MVGKTLENTDVNGAHKNVPDIQVFGNGDMFQLLCKASSQSEGWMKSTKAMEIPGVGCVVQVTTQQRNPDNSYSVAEALTFVPGVRIIATTTCCGNEDHGEQVTARSLVAGACDGGGNVKNRAQNIGEPWIIDELLALVSLEIITRTEAREMLGIEPSNI